MTKYAEDIVNLLKYNSDLSHDDKVLAVSIRLEQMVNKLNDEREARKIPYSDHSAVIPADLLINKKDIN